MTRVATGVQNLIFPSQAFAGWGATGAAFTVQDNTPDLTAPDGTPTASKWSLSANGPSSYGRFKTPAFLAGVTYGLSVCARAGTYGNFTVDLQNGGGLAALFDLFGGVIKATSGGVAAAMSSAGSGWWLCSVVGQFTNAVPEFYFNGSSSAILRNAWSPAGTETLYVWNAQLVQANWSGPFPVVTTAGAVGAATPPRNQASGRVAASGRVVSSGRVVP